MSDPVELSLTEALKALQERKLSASELTEAYLDRIARDNPVLNAFIAITADKARAMAAASDARLAAREGRALEGIPIGIKDLFCTKGVESRAASKVLSGFIPTYESTITDNLWQAGAIMLGKLNMDEFAMGSSNEYSAAGPVINPWKANNDDRARTPGGSSGGSAAAIAARLCLAATASDTGGSIRQPAGFTGTVGIKPTYGRASRYGIIAFASSLDQAGPIARNISDAALMLEIMCSHDPKDSTSLPAAIPDWRNDPRRSIKGMNIGIPNEYRFDNMPDAVSRLWQNGAKWLSEAGANIVELSLPHTAYALPAYYIIAPAEASSNLARYDGMRYGLRCELPELFATYATTRSQGFGDEVQKRLLIGTYVLSAGYYDAYYLRAQKVRTLIARDFQNAFAKVDALLVPTVPGSAFVLGKEQQDPIEMYMNDVSTVAASMAGLPALSVPAGLDDSGLPLGLQVIAPAMDEATCLRIGGAIEAAAPQLPVPQQWWRQA